MCLMQKDLVYLIFLCVHISQYLLNGDSFIGLVFSFCHKNKSLRNFLISVTGHKKKYFYRKIIHNQTNIEMTYEFK